MDASQGATLDVQLHSGHGRGEQMSKSRKNNNLPQQRDALDCYCVSEGEVTSRPEFHAGD